MTVQEPNILERKHSGRLCANSYSNLLCINDDYMYAFAYIIVHLLKFVLTNLPNHAFFSDYV